MRDNVKRVKTDAAPAGNPPITRLTPFADALKAVDAIARAVAPREVASGDATGCVLAEDVRAQPCPARPIALQDGFAVTADEVADAGPYTPIALRKTPPRVETGDELSEGDAVAPPELIAMRGGKAEAVGALTRGDGVLPAGGDVGEKPLFTAGARLRASDYAVLAAAGVARVQVRMPKLRILAAREDLRLRPAVEFIARDCRVRGGEAAIQNGADLDHTLGQSGVDALIIVGGTGAGTRDESVAAMARAGRLSAHGIGISPGQTAAIGQAGSTPVLAIPGRLDAAMAAWLMLGRHLLTRLAGDARRDPGITLTLSRKVTSTVGIAEFVPMRRTGENVEPLASKFLPLSALAAADGWIVVPPDSEGYPAGAKVAVNPLP